MSAADALALAAWAALMLAWPTETAGWTLLAAGTAAAARKMIAR